MLPPPIAPAATRWISTVAALIAVALVVAEACFKVHIGPAEQNNIVCQCNATHCDQLGELEWPVAPARFVSVVSSLAGQRWNRSQLTATEEPEAGGMQQQQQQHLIQVDANERRQEVLGYGGAFSDSACLKLASLDEPLRSRALEDYFSPRGAHYNMGRVPIGGTDMSSRPYTLDDDLPEGVHEDLELRHFRLQEEDMALKVPMIKRAQELFSAGSGSQAELKLVANSWSAPRWMKSDRSLVQGRLMGNSSSGPYYAAYASYLLRFLDEYERLNVTMWALSPQNEPYSPKRLGTRIINYNSLNFEPEEMADYLEHSLVPRLLASGRLARDSRASARTRRLRLFIWDDVIDGLADYLGAAFKGSQLQRYADGLAIHWYTQGAKGKGYERIGDTRRLLGPNYLLLSTEACFVGAPQAGSWRRGELYARDILENLRAGSSGWIDWNLALDMAGGPSWSHNAVDAAILVDSQRQLYYRNPMYYALAHVSRFLRFGGRVLASQVVESRSSGDNESGPALVVAAAENPTQVAGQPTRPVGLVVLNRRPTSQRARLRLTNCPLQRGQPELVLELAAASVTSVAFSC